MELLLIALTVLFVGLKLTDHIQWSWPAVLAPLWLPYGLILLALLLTGSVVGV